MLRKYGWDSLRGRRSFQRFLLRRQRLLLPSDPTLTARSHASPDDA